MASRTARCLICTNYLAIRHAIANTAARPDLKCLNMSYMQEVLLSRDVAVQYPQYSLHYYYERYILGATLLLTTLYQISWLSSQRPLGALTLPLQGVPALFLPGNAGSHKQARSSASIALRMHSSDFPRKRHFDFFTISFNEASITHPIPRLSMAIHVFPPI